MTLLLMVLGPVMALLLVGLNLLVAIRGPNRLRRLGRTLIRGLHRRAEYVELWRPATPGAAPKKLSREALKGILGTKLGIWAASSSALFVVIWALGWVSPRYSLGYLAHLGGAWAGGIVLVSLAFGSAWAVTSAWRMGRAQLFASWSGFTRVWIARPLRAESSLGDALRSSFALAHRIELLDFTGYELLAKGSSDEGGVVAAILADFPEKETRVLLFNPCACDVDPDRKHNTVIQSQLGSMEMSREAFESKLRATMDRIDILNRRRRKPIEVRLYAEKPSFRVLVAGETAFLGAIDPRDAAGEFPLYEARRQSDGPSLHAAARSHFLRVWGDSLPAQVEAQVQAPALSGTGTPLPRTIGSQTPAPRRRVAVAE